MPIILSCKRVKFFSPYDKDAFFEWTHRISSIFLVKGVKDSIQLHIHTSQITKSDIYNIVALYRRYKIDIKELEQLPKKYKKWIDGFTQGYSICVYPTE